MEPHHVDDGRTIHSFANLFLVRCPQCDACAQVVRVGDSSFKPSGKLTCTHCGYAKVGRAEGSADNEAQDWYFHHPLWLQTPCCGHTLWAFNAEHLAWLQSYIEADHRPGLGFEEAKRLQIRNATLASRMPEWMIVAKHRAEVLRGIQRLRAELVA